MAEFPALPLWTDAYLADTSHLSYEEHGLYLHLLMTMWRTPGCQVPNDEEWINRRCRGNAAAMLRLCQEFCTLSEDGKWWHQKRLRKQWQWCLENSQKQRQKANSRWGNDNHSYNGNAAAMPGQSHGNASKSKSKSKSFLEDGCDLKKEEDGFIALPSSLEFTCWKAYAFEKNIPLWREINQRELEGRPFNFESQWPPTGAPNGKENQSIQT